MENIIINVMNHYGYLGIFILILIENLLPPIPSELILTFGGFITINSNLTIFGVIISSTLGSLFGALILYYLGSILNKDRLVKLASSKVGKLLKINIDDIEDANEWFNKKGYKAVFFCRFVPVIRSLISIPAGMSRMPIIMFLFYTTIGSLCWNTILICIGAFAGNKADIFLIFIDKFSNLLLALLLLIIITKKYRKNKKIIVVKKFT